MPDPVVVLPPGSNPGPVSTPHLPGTLSDRIIVKYQDTVALPPDPSGTGVDLDVPGFASWKAAFPGLTNRRLFDRPAAKIDALLLKAEQRDSTYVRVNLRNYIELAVPTGIAPQNVLHMVRTHATVQRAYIQAPPTDLPTVDASDDTDSALQTYLDSHVAEYGVDAKYAWTFTGGDGAGQTLLDIERGWKTDHPDLATRVASVTGTVDDAWVEHGTGVLGIIAATDNTFGMVGIAPNVTTIRCMSSSPTGAYSVPRAVELAVEVLDHGHVLLLEEQVDVKNSAGATVYINAPAEAELATFDIIRLATAIGITVVACAGNGELPLDDYVDEDDGRIFNRDDLESFRDSGAILVGGSDPDDEHKRDVRSNYGNRVDCFGWAKAKTLSRSTTSPYGGELTGTSAAAAIIAGVALVVQGLRFASTGRGFGGWQLRDILSDPENGWPSSDDIGSIPDLRKIIDDEALELAPDVYARDHVGDDGDPHEGSISESPDVFVQAGAPDPNANAKYGEGSGTEDSLDLGSQVEAGHDHVVYVRMRNRGGADAENVKATVYYALPASLLDPDDWTEIGSTTVDVPKGDVLTVADGIVWPSASVPASGHYCFVALVGHDHDPAPLPADFLDDWEYFKRYIRVNNNVTWRNFNVVEMEEATASDAAPDPGIDDETGAGADGGAGAARPHVGELVLSFDIAGAWDRARPMAVEIGGRLPRSASIRLELPRTKLSLFGLRDVPGRWPAVQGDRIRIPLSSWREFREVPLAKKERVRARLIIQVPPELRRYRYEIFVRQLHHGDEVGRVTWRLVPKRTPLPARARRPLPRPVRRIP